MTAVPARLLRPRALVWIAYALLACSGLSFFLTDDSESVRVIVGPWAPMVTGVMLLIGSVIGTIGSLVRVYRVELAGYPFIVGVWAVYAVAVGARSLGGETPAGFAFLLGAGAVGVLGRGWELHNASRVTRELAVRQQRRRETS